tara:strand:- start:257 stop:559 length:303 start_codon:yes stop_codon:yes gene_type:complete
MVKRGEVDDLGGLWLEGHGLSEVSETLGLSPRVPRAAPKPSDAGCGARGGQPWHCQDGHSDHAGTPESVTGESLCSALMMAESMRLRFSSELACCTISSR